MPGGFQWGCKLMIHRWSDSMSAHALGSFKLKVSRWFSICIHRNTMIVYDALCCDSSPMRQCRVRSTEFRKVAFRSLEIRSQNIPSTLSSVMNLMPVTLVWFANHDVHLVDSATKRSGDEMETRTSSSSFPLNYSRPKAFEQLLILTIKHLIFMY